LRALFGADRIAVHSDGIGGFSLAGTARLALSGASAECWLSVVAGAGFEPATSGL
jgi:hypothetical protein